MGDTPQPAAPAAAPPETVTTGNVQTSGTNVPTQPNATAPKAPATQAEELFELNVGGKVKKLTKSEVIKLAQISDASNERFERGAQLSKKAESIINKAKGNPIQALMEAGCSDEEVKKAFETWYTEKYIEPETLTPEQRRSKEMERKLAQLEKEKADREEGERLAELEQLTTKQREYYQQQIVDAIKTSGLPRTKFVAQKFAFYLNENLTKGWDAPMDLIISQVKKDHRANYADLNENSSVEQLIETLGESVINKIRTHDLKKLKESRERKPANLLSDDSRRNTGRISMAEAEENLRKIRRGEM